MFCTYERPSQAFTSCFVNPYVPLTLPVLVDLLNSASPSQPSISKVPKSEDLASLNPIKGLTVTSTKSRLYPKFLSYIYEGEKKKKKVNHHSTASLLFQVRLQVSCHQILLFSNSAHLTKKDTHHKADLTDFHC